MTRNTIYVAALNHVANNLHIFPDKYFEASPDQENIGNQLITADEGQGHYVLFEKSGFTKYGEGRSISYTVDIISPQSMKPIETLKLHVTHPHAINARNRNGVSDCLSALAASEHTIRQSQCYGPHDYQLEGVCKALDGIDILAVTPTGSGKTGFLIMYLIVMRVLMTRPERCANPPLHFKKNPAMVVAKKFAAARISSLVINKETTSQAMLAKPPFNIWDRAPDVEMLLLSPEQLVSPSFEALLKDKTYQTRVVALGVDEVHLMNTWGQSFRREFEQIGLMRARFTVNHPCLIALTATLQTGAWFHSVCHFLGLHDGHFYLIRRSNMRYDLRFVFRTVESGARSHTFPELDWVLEGDRKIIIFCPVISMAHRVATYLYARSNGLEDLDQRIRMYHSLNWASYNSDTLSSMHDDARSRVTVATDALAVGIDVSGTDDVVLYDTVLPSNTDTILQKAGRIRDGRGRGSRVVVYLPKKATELAQSALSDLKKGRRTSTAGSGKKGRGGAAVDVGVAQLVLAPCKVDLLNTLYDNPKTDKPLYL
ncbi:hypothetical protein VTO73DRAFT_4264 [Trametes versicolor]